MVIRHRFAHCEFETFHGADSPGLEQAECLTHVSINIEWVGRRSLR